MFDIIILLVCVYLRPAKFKPLILYVDGMMLLKTSTVRILITLISGIESAAYREGRQRKLVEIYIV